MGVIKLEKFLCVHRKEIVFESPLTKQRPTLNLFPSFCCTLWQCNINEAKKTVTHFFILSYFPQQKTPFIPISYSRKATQLSFFEWGKFWEKRVQKKFVLPNTESRSYVCGSRRGKEVTITTPPPCFVCARASALEVRGGSNQKQQWKPPRGVIQELGCSKRR